MIRRVYIGIQLMQGALASKEATEALAFCVLIKTRFVSSRVQSAKISRLKELFGIGSTRMCRIVRNGIALGYLKREGDDIVAVSVKQDDCYNYSYNFSHEAAKSGGISLKDIITELQRAVLLNHISKQTDTEDSVNIMMTSTNHKAVKRARAKVNKSMQGGLNGELHTGLSIRKAMEVTNTKRHKARKLLKSLVIAGLVTKAAHIERIDMPFDIDMRQLNIERADMGMRGYVFRSRKGNAHFIRFADKYTYACDLISYLKPENSHEI